MKKRQRSHASFVWRVQISLLALSLKFSLAPAALATIFFVFDSSVLESHKNFGSRLWRSQHDNFYLFFKVNLLLNGKHQLMVAAVAGSGGA